MQDLQEQLDGYCSISTTGGFLSNTNSCAYRFVWGYKDANDNLIIGSPSGRATITNGSGGDRIVAIRLYVPDTVIVGYFYQAYRSVQVGTGIEPPDDLQLVYEGNVTSGDISTGYVDFTDITSDDLRGAFLYTSPTQEGILQSNDEPPLQLIYAHTKT